MGCYMVTGRWVYVGAKTKGKLSPTQKATIIAACEKLIQDVLIPRYLPEIRPTEYNYPISIYGKLNGLYYRFITRFKSDHPDSTAPEFDAPFARLECVGNHFDLSYHRYTGEWIRVYEKLTLEDALARIAEGEYFHPC